MVLFEVITALTIFTLVAFSLIMALDTAFTAAKERNEVNAVLVGLDNQMALLHGNQITPTEQDLPDDGSGILYHLVVAPEQMVDQKKQAVPGMYRATITARWKSDGQDEDRTITQLFYQP